MKTASRTLVKSPPEVWEQLDHPGRMEGLMSALVGHATDVEVYERVEESKLAWKAGDEARIEVELAEKGWGTNVSVSAENGSEPTKLEGWLDAVLDELATPQKRPFEGMTETPAGTLADAFTTKSAPAPKGPPVQQTEPEQPVAEEPKAEEPQPEAPADPVEEEKREPAPAAEPAPAPKKKRFFGLF
jgi:outer membrane biosynthesis protein TonB